MKVMLCLLSPCSSMSSYCKRRLMTLTLEEEGRRDKSKEEEGSQQSRADEWTYQIHIHIRKSFLLPLGITSILSRSVLSFSPFLAKSGFRKLTVPGPRTIRSPSEHRHSLARPPISLSKKLLTSRPELMHDRWQPLERWIAKHLA
jgi:hypothetical protein